MMGDVHTAPKCSSIQQAELERGNVFLRFPKDSYDSADFSLFINILLQEKKNRHCLTITQDRTVRIDVKIRKVKNIAVKAFNTL